MIKGVGRSEVIRTHDQWGNPETASNNVQLPHIFHLPHSSTINEFDHSLYNSQRNALNSVLSFVRIGAECGGKEGRLQRQLDFVNLQEKNEGMKER